MSSPFSRLRKRSKDSEFTSEMHQIEEMDEVQMKENFALLQKELEDLRNILLVALKAQENIEIQLKLSDAQFLEIEKKLDALQARVASDAKIKRIVEIMLQQKNKKPKFEE